MRTVSLLFHDVYRDDPSESGFFSAAANRYKLTVSDFTARRRRGRPPGAANPRQPYRASR